MTGADDVGESEPTSFGAALSRLDHGVRQRKPLRVTVKELVEVIRGDREAVDAYTATAKGCAGQFETIHPFLDGNGRLGRLLIVFFLGVRDRLPEPLLYLSPYFEARRQEYYDALQGVRQEGDLDQWLGLFLDGVGTQAIDAVARAERLTDLRERYRGEVRAVTRGVANQVVELALEQPVLNARVVEDRLGVSRPAALKALRQLADL